jgi:hypothetical protein
MPRWASSIFSKLRPLGHHAQGEIGSPGPFLPASDTISYKQDQMAQEAQKGEMMISRCIYVAQWEWKAATRDQRQAEAEYTRLARILCSTSKASQPKPQSRRESPAIKRLVSALGYTGG